MPPNFSEHLVDYGSRRANEGPGLTDFKMPGAFTDDDPRRILGPLTVYGLVGLALNRERAGIALRVLIRAAIKRQRNARLDGHLSGLGQLSQRKPPAGCSQIARRLQRSQRGRDGGAIRRHWISAISSAVTSQGDFFTGLASPGSIESGDAPTCSYARASGDPA